LETQAVMAMAMVAATRRGVMAGPRQALQHYHGGVFSYGAGCVSLHETIALLLCVAPCRAQWLMLKGSHPQSARRGQGTQVGGPWLALDF